MLGVPAVVQQAPGQNNNNTLRFHPVCKHHVAAQKPEVLPKVLAVMNSIKANPNQNDNAPTKQFFTLNDNGARAVALRRWSTQKSLCDFRRACEFIEDYGFCFENAAFDRWPTNADQAIKMRTLFDTIAYPSKFGDHVTSAARANGFYD